MSPNLPIHSSPTKSAPSYLLPLLISWYYIRLTILSPIALIFQQSFIIHHPTRPLPTVISSPGNTTIHSFKINTDTPIHLQFPFISPRRIWSAPHHFQQRIAGDLPLTHSIILNGKLSGPPLRQGTGIVYQKDILYIAEEIGRCPNQDGLVLTRSILLPTRTQIPLFIPHHYLDPSGVRDYAPNHPLRHPTSPSETLTASLPQNSNFSVPLPSNA